MARREFKGAAAPTRLVSGIGTGDTSFSIFNNAGWPTGGANGPFTVILDPDTSDEEHILVGSQSGGTLSSVTRGIGDTIPATHSAGVDGSVIHGTSRLDYDEANRHINIDTDDNHIQYMRTDGVRHDLTARHSAGTVVPTGAPTTITPDAILAEGAGTLLARSTHVHGIVTDTPVSIGTVLAEGAGNNFARSTHVHDLGVGSIDTPDLLAANVVNTAAIIDDAVTFPKFQSLHQARVWTDVDTTLVVGSPVVVNFTQESYDVDNAFNLTTDTYTVPETGFYEYGWTLHTNVSAAGERYVGSILANGVTLLTTGPEAQGEPSSRAGLTGHDQQQLTSGDTLQLRVTQLDGVARNIDGVAARPDFCFFYIRRVA